jgi:DNA-binding NarL/FixJ family response regulator
VKLKPAIPSSDSRSPLGDALVRSGEMSEAPTTEIEQPLSDEQVRVLTLVCDGDSDWTISRKTGLSLRTVQRRIQSLRHLLQVDSRAALAARSIELGFVKRR